MASPASLLRSSAEAPESAPVSHVTSLSQQVSLDAADVAMNRYADGDDAAFAEVFMRLGPRLQGFLRRLTGSRDLADDLVQETFLRMHHARGAFARGRPVLPWAYAIARNCHISHARSSRARLQRSSFGSEGLLEHVVGAEGTGEQIGIARQTALTVERALLGMTEARREAFVLLRYEGLSVAVAAQIAGVTEGALKLRAFHAYEIIRQALAEQGQLREPEPPVTCA